MGQLQPTGPVAKLRRGRSFLGVPSGADALLNMLTSYWPLTEYSDSAAPVERRDVVGNNHLVDFGNMPSIAGLAGPAIAPGGTHWLSNEVTPALSIGGTDFAVDGWFYFTSAFDGTAMARQANNGAGEWQIRFTNGSAKVNFDLRLATVLVATVLSPAITRNAWHYIYAHYIVATREAALSIDNAALTLVTASADPAVTAEPFVISGRTGGGNLHHGRSQHVGLWKRTLTPAERTRRYNAGVPLPYPFIPVPTVRILLQSPGTNQIFQRSGTTGTISIKGNVVYGSGNYDVEAAWNGGGYTQIAAGISSNFAGSLSAQPQGQGTLDVRIKTAGTGTVIASTSVAYVGIGEVFIIAGQSNAVGQGTNHQAWSHATLRPGMFAADYRWKVLADPTGDETNEIDGIATTAGGSAWLPLATSLMATLGVPVAFVPSAKGGSAIATWAPGADHLDRTTLYGSMNYRASLTGCRAVLWHQGEQDVSLGTSQAAYNASLDTLANAIAADRGVPLIAATIHYGSYANVNNAIAEAVGDNVNVKAGPNNAGITTSPDALHFKTDPEIQGLAARWWAALQAAFGW